MIIGNGMMARMFSAYEEFDDVVVLAAGVSNSRETRPESFDRETRLVEKTIDTIGSKLLIYFSTCSIYDPDTAGTPYVRHKLSIEKMVRERVANYLLFRLPQVVGNTSNLTTLTSFLYNNIVTQQPIDVWDNACRYIIDADDAVRIVSYVVDNGMFRNSTVNVASRPCLVADLVNTLEEITGKLAVCTHSERGSYYAIDTTDIKPILEQLKIEFGPEYLSNVLSKYYASRHADLSK
jgi:nucleoside-diphosphate-sugar epimerase